MKKSLIFYGIVIVLSSAVFWFIVSQSDLIEAGKFIPSSEISRGGEFFQTLGDQTGRLFVRNVDHPLSRLLLQIIAIVSFARLLGFLFRKIGQPSVIGEIIAGIALGPSLLGWLLPDVSAFLFAKEQVASLQLLSQIGLILFMFIIGMELNPSAIRERIHSAVVISHASILFPFLLGMGLSLYLYRDHAPDNIAFLSFALFMGISMSITAFPVLARILQERNMSSSRLGSLALACAAADDVTAWSILAAVVAIARTGSALRALPVVFFAAVFFFIMIRLIRPLMARFGEIYTSRDNLGPGAVIAVFLFVFLSAFSTELIGIHALFGAFLAGAVIPSARKFRTLISEKIHDLSVLVLLPLFFAFSGLRTQIGMLNTPSAWILCGVIILIAVTGKFAGSAIAAKTAGESWRDSLSIGVLMNTRGLMELIVLNIGYELGILSPEIFSMMVIMALVTTFMTGPGMSFLQKFSERKEMPEKLPGGTLIAFGRSEAGETLLRLASIIGMPGPLHAAHFFTPQGYSPADEMPEDTAGSDSLMEESRKLGAELTLLRRETQDVASDIVKHREEVGADLLLLGGAKSIFSSDALGGIVRQVLNQTQCAAGIVTDRNVKEIKKILILATKPGDFRILDFFLPASLSERCQFAVFSSQALPEKYSAFPLYAGDVSFSAGEFSLIAIPVEQWGNRKTGQGLPYLILRLV